MPSRPYRPRLVEPRLEALLAELPAVLLVGPRAAGKTTTAARHARTTVRLDRPADAAPFRADPDAALRGLPEPVLLDEWQLVPDVLGAVKRAVDADPRPGRYLITGSVRADLEQATWPGTGRVVRVLLPGLSIREIEGDPAAPSLLERIQTHGLEAAETSARNTPDLRDYLALALRSGFPEPALHLATRARETWLDSYVEQLLTRDVSLVDAGRDPERLRRYLTAYANVTAQVVDDRTLCESAGINRKTAVAYEQLLKNLFVVESLPAWSTNRLRQLIHAPRRMVIDAGLAASVLRLDAETVMKAGPLMGSLIETFVVAQLRAEVAASGRGPRLFHLRTRGGRHEVDIVVELAPNRVLGIEVKAAASPTTEDAKHLAWLCSELGSKCVGGLLLHTGARTFRLGPRVLAAPIATLWR